MSLTAEEQRKQWCEYKRDWRKKNPEREYIYRVRFCVKRKRQRLMALL